MAEPDPFDASIFDAEVTARLRQLTNSPGEFAYAGNFFYAADLLERASRIALPPNRNPTLDGLSEAHFDGAQIALLLPLATAAREVGRQRAEAAKAAVGVVIDPDLDARSFERRARMYGVARRALKLDDTWKFTIEDIAHGKGLLDRAEDLRTLAHIYRVEFPRLERDDDYRASDRTDAGRDAEEIFAALHHAGVSLAFRAVEDHVWALVTNTYEDVRATLTWSLRKQRPPIRLPSL